MRMVTFIYGLALLVAIAGLFYMNGAINELVAQNVQYQAETAYFPLHTPVQGSVRHVEASRTAFSYKVTQFIVPCSDSAQDALQCAAGINVFQGQQ